MLITLPHTGLQIPHKRLRIRKLCTLALANGVALTAQLLYSGRPAGLICNNGDGGATIYQPYAGSPFDRQAFSRYVADCRTPHGLVKLDEVILDLLVEEHETNRHLNQAQQRGNTLARHTHQLPTEPHGDQEPEARPHPDASVRGDIVCEIGELHKGAEHTTGDQRANLIAGLDHAAACDQPGTWQVWTGHTWTPITEPSLGQPTVGGSAPDVVPVGKAR